MYLKSGHALSVLAGTAVQCSATIAKADDFRKIYLYMGKQSSVKRIVSLGALVDGLDSYRGLRLPAAGIGAEVMLPVFELGCGSRGRKEASNLLYRVLLPDRTAATR